MAKQDTPPPEQSDKSEISLTPHQKAVIELFARGDQKRRDKLIRVLPRYWQELETMRQEALREMRANGRRSQKSLDEDMETARDLVEELVTAGVYPVITTSKARAAEKKSAGIRAKETWIPGLKISVGIIGMPLYRPAGQQRTAFEITVDNPSHLEPRLTGPLPTFAGVVAFKGFEHNTIPPALLRELTL